MRADGDKDDNTRNGSRKFLTSSLTLYMKGLNISEVRKSYNHRMFWTTNSYEAQSATKKISTKNRANHTESHVKSTKNDDL